ncbi:universal stress protein [Mycolicibacterium sp. 050158]|uniref:universal stress protein n=1 Tax=Mycolicibacterium sp. 050158 TaxID=3090602 RepID=UPI00299EB386|nr:universal stress protein [Mycolicibacterium sp. 050158]MDX1890765.1 universal stress protein [Mycolicibacterium sp. 050158]
MTDIPPGATVVVGIDGSRAAVHAAQWAVDEAISRDVPLRLVHVASESSTARTSPVELPLGIEYAETVLRQADAAIEATGKDVKVETAILRGDPTALLVAESRNAELVCLGTTGIGVVSEKFWGSTATGVANEARCPVAIIRDRGEGRRPHHEWIAVAVKVCTDDEDVVMTAMDEARLRHAPLLAVGLWQEDFGFTPYDELDRAVESWRQRYPDVHVYPVTTRSGLVQFLNDDEEPIGMVVVGPEESRRVAQIVGPHSHPILGHPECSVLIVRH